MIKDIFKYLKWLLLPVGLIHLVFVWLRNVLYDKKIFKAQKLPRPVISIGNIQMGGSGKTPFTVMLVELLQQYSLKVAVLSRGYKRRSRETRIVKQEKQEAETAHFEILGDEPLLILQHIEGGILGVGADRYAVGKEILRFHSADIFLLDDGFQHRRLHRDLNICLIDVTRWAAHPFLFPFSYLRDSKSSLRRADIIILTKFEQIPSTAETLLTRLSNEEKIEPEKIQAQKVAALCGIANPGNFFDLLKDLEKVVQSAAGAGAKWLIVTEKDAVKLKSILSTRDDSGLNVLVFSVSFHLEEKIKLIDAIREITALK
jgi:tetraacyldisaccharide 4'-kinase